MMGTYNIHPPLPATDLIRNTLDHLEVAEVALDKFDVGHDATLRARLPDLCDGFYCVVLLARQDEDTSVRKCHGAGDFKTYASSTTGDEDSLTS